MPALRKITKNKLLAVYKQYAFINELVTVAVSSISPLNES